MFFQCLRLKFRFNSIRAFTCVALLMLLTCTEVLAFDHQHLLWNQTLSEHVTGGTFNYKALKSEIASKANHPFLSYLKQLEALSKASFETFNSKQRMAFLINAYNAFTVKLILDNYPVKSIKDLGGFFSKPWAIKFFNLLDGSIQSLDPIEHEALRPVFKDYRIHAVVNCASISCPELRKEAYVAEKLESQLEDQMSIWLQDKSKNYVEDKTKTLFLSKIFDWYGDDFVKWGGGIHAVLKKHGSKMFTDEILKNYKIRYLPYDWKLNESK